MSELPTLVPKDSDSEILRKFRKDGLLWLVNTAILHPRGYALAMHFDENDEPIGLSITDFNNYAAFDMDDEQISDLIQNYRDAELRRSEGGRHG